jgi:hypothetical protein
MLDLHSAMSLDPMDLRLCSFLASPDPMFGRKGSPYWCRFLGMPYYFARIRINDLWEDSIDNFPTFWPGLFFFSSWFHACDQVGLIWRQPIAKIMPQLPVSTNRRPDDSGAKYSGATLCITRYFPCRRGAVIFRTAFTEFPKRQRSPYTYNISTHAYCKRVDHRRTLTVINHLYSTQQ